MRRLDKKLVAIGFIGGILGIVGVFLPWVTGRVSGSRISVSGWELTRMSVTFSMSPYVILIGSILSLAGGIGMIGLDSNRLRYLLPAGGIIVIIGWIWAATNMGDPTTLNYGFYTCIVGAVLSLFGSLGLRE